MTDNLREEDLSVRVDPTMQLG